MLRLLGFVVGVYTKYCSRRRAKGILWMCIFLRMAGKFVQKKWALQNEMRFTFLRLRTTKSSIRLKMCVFGFLCVESFDMRKSVKIASYHSIFCSCRKTGCPTEIECARCYKPFVPFLSIHLFVFFCKFCCCFLLFLS